jgi:hypothetical protein
MAPGKTKGVIKTGKAAVKPKAQKGNTMKLRTKEKKVVETLQGGVSKKATEKPPRKQAKSSKKEKEEMN